jgi:hypothetical protein
MFSLQSLRSTAVGFRWVGIPFPSQSGQTEEFGGLGRKRRSLADWGDQI